MQVVPHNAKTEVTLYQDAAPQENRRIRGRFDSATTDTITLWLKDGQTRTFPKSDVRKVRIPRPFSKRWPGWITLAASVLAAELFRLWVQDLPASYAALNLGIAAGATAVVFVNSEMGTIYKRASRIPIAAARRPAARRPGKRFRKAARSAGLSDPGYRLRRVIMRDKTTGEAIEHCGTTVLNEELQVSLVLR